MYFSSIFCSPDIRGDWLVGISKGMSLNLWVLRGRWIEFIVTYKCFFLIFKLLKWYYWVFVIDLQLLRTQLHSLQAYLFSCKQPVAEELLSKVGGRSYLLDSVHIYSLRVSDLECLYHFVGANNVFIMYSHIWEALFWKIGNNCCSIKNVVYISCIHCIHYSCMCYTGIQGRTRLAQD